MATGQPELIAGRFRVAREIGRGGMARVFEVLDTTSGRKLALKRLLELDDTRKQRRTMHLFEREFHTLAHLTHPRVVEVFDYGMDEVSPYYTMELLDGGDLQQQAPVPWARACALARDVASALSLLHSRRMVYRDLSPRNVRCTSDGRAKLIDFGAMVAMGPTKQVVGTPAYCAPEALNQQPLDARTDLYSLGATLYYTLVGRHAYAARDFKQLRDAWRTRLVPPSMIVAGIPPALDALLLDLLNLDPAARPANAAEVMQRLYAIEGLPLDEQLLVSQSYLSTPVLVGREALLTRARAKCMRAMRGRGGAIAIEGSSGVGRTRLLDACLLEGKLLGALALRADAGDGQSDYGVVSALAEQLFEAAPELALEAARPKLGVLAHAIPELLERAPGSALAVFDNPDQIRGALQEALREWLLAIGRQRALMLAVDDLHAIDEPSAALVALLARDIKRSALFIVASVETGVEHQAAATVELFREAAVKLELGPLRAELSEKLLRSVFGDVPHVQQLSVRLHALSNGNPRDLMQLAQHLLDKGIVRHQAGAWTLPSSIEPGELPASMALALAARIDVLSPHARVLARAMALCDRNIAFEECEAISEASGSSVMQALDELVEAQIAAHAGEYYTIARRDWGHALLEALDARARAQIHRGLARVFERRGDEDFRVARHLLLAGDSERGLDALIKHADESQKVTHHSMEAFTRLIHSMPADWYACYEDAIRICVELKRPASHIYALRSRLAGLVGAFAIPDRTQLLGLIEQLRKESGLADYAALDPGLPPIERLQKALEATQARYLASSEHERVLEPIVAIRQLARAVISVSAVISTGLDYGLWCSLPSLGPLEPLSPALTAVGMLVAGLGARMTARNEQARGIYCQLLDRLAQPDRAGLDVSHHQATVLGVSSGLGMLEASMGLDDCLKRAEQIHEHPMYQVNTLLIRMLHHLARGEAREADQLKERVERLRIQNSARQWFEGTHLLTQVVLNAAAEDLTRLKETSDEIELLARRFDGWVPVRHYALGEYHRVRGDQASALVELEQALRLSSAGTHQLWPNAAGALLRALYDAGRYAEACERAKALLDAAAGAGLGYVSCFIRMPFALAAAKLGRMEEARAHADTALDALRQLGTRGLIAALAYETRARVAIARKDHEDFAHCAAAFAREVAEGKSRALTAKYERLKQEATRADLELTERPPPVEGLTEPLTLSQLTSMLDSARGSAERARQTLMILLRNSGASEGFLFTMTGGGPELAAKLGDQPQPARLLDTVRDYLDAEVQSQDMHTASMIADPVSMPSDVTGSHGERYRLVLMSHPVPGGFAITGVAVAIVEPGHPFVYPGPIAAQLSRILLECGDVAAATVAD